MQVMGRETRTKRLVVVADDSLIVEAMALGLRESGEFELLGHVNAWTEKSLRCSTTRRTSCWWMSMGAPMRPSR